jgi:hypothetical protein
VSALVVAHARPLDVLYVSRERFLRGPQVGINRPTTWGRLVSFLSRPTVGLAKNACGAWSPGLYRDGVHRKTHLVHVCALLVDVDERGDVDVVADTLGQYACVVFETFSSTVEAPRCRAVLLLAVPVDVPTYEAVHGVVRAHLGARGIVVDATAKDATRFSYVPVRRPGDSYRVRVVDGDPLEPARVLLAQPSRPSPSSPRQLSRVPARERDGRYARAALRNAAARLGGACEGQRHGVLLREAWGLARLLDEPTIAAALLPVWVAVAGEGRRREGERAIRDAVQARGRDR